MKTLIEKALPGKGETKITLVESQDSYEQLLDDYLDGIDVLDNETTSLTDTPSGLYIPAIPHITICYNYQ